MFTIYTQENCPNCEVLKNFMRGKNIEYTEIDINSDFSVKAKMIANDIETTPVVEYNNTLFSGEISNITNKLFKLRS